MGWQELQDKYLKLQAEGNSAQDAVRLLKDDVLNFVNECVENPVKMTEVMPDLGKAVQDNPVFADLLFFLFFCPKGGWGV